MKLHNIMISLLVASTLCGCDDMWEPAKENYRDKGDIHDDPAFALGILLNGYSRIPGQSYTFSDVATDDAVSNLADNGYRKLATGEWTSNVNAMDAWTNSYAAIQYMNIMLEEVEKVRWDESGVINRMFADRTAGEAYALRGLFYYYLLQAHGGPTASGMMGVPLILESQTPDSDHNLPRATFSECIHRIYADFDAAQALLPLDFEDITSDSQIPARYAGASSTDYNRVFGHYNRLRITSRIIEGVRSRVALLAASPAFNTASDIALWTYAADAAAKVIDRIGGVAGLSDSGNIWYANRAEINGLADGVNPAEILWRGNTSNTNSLETDNYPPTLYGSGRVNPTQNLVDAFPMKNGFPISDTRSLYDADKPMADRDPRLALYILADGERMGPSNVVITTLGTSTNDCVNRIEKSTRTGYYLRKLLRTDVNLDPLYANTQRHYQPYIRYTEIFLNYAEAANEAYGPMGDGGHGYSAYEVIKAIRKRAGVGGNDDAYLEECKASRDMMRRLIHNERRLELCFEGFRFWDLRRWKVGIDELTAPALGTNMQGGKRITTTVENRIFSPHQYYGPIPYSECIKYTALQQNAGW